ncbi:WhiB family transcriptional regulator [Pseudonocardia nigra]|uniref:WhiB family transcriptional regulator n=1 Tax=Pseudonocardia nigra TaxID=1921578 RepID=UPI001C5FB0A5|nr:WhiB family transcriptional regulator [Pseudonocardia nigra]
MTGRWNWRGAARCRTTDAEGLFVTGAHQREAREFCRTCAVRTECLAHALDHRVEFGVWGGMTERERRALLRSRPEVPSWTDLLNAARTAHYASAADETADALAEVVERERELVDRGAAGSAVPESA